MESVRRAQLQRVTDLACLINVAEPVLSSYAHAVSSLFAGTLQSPFLNNVLVNTMLVEISIAESLNMQVKIT